MRRTDYPAFALLPAAGRWEKMGQRCSATAGEALETTTPCRRAGSLRGTRPCSRMYAPARALSPRRFDARVAAGWATGGKRRSEGAFPSRSPDQPRQIKYEARSNAALHYRLQRCRVEGTEGAIERRVRHMLASNRLSRPVRCRNLRGRLGSVEERAERGPRPRGKGAIRGWR